jgi:homoserine kinase
LEDVIVEPTRSILIPFYDEMKAMAISQGALGFNISGSGPTMFALSRNIDTASAIEKKANLFYRDKGIDVVSFVSPINPKGAEIIS